MADTTAGMGHNTPPDPLIERAAAAVDQANKWLTERNDLDQWDADIADRASFFVSQLSTAFADLDGQRLNENREHTARQKAKYETPLTLLTRAKDALVNLRRGWLQREERRKEAERAAAAANAKRLADEAAKVIERAREEANRKGGDPLRAQLAAEEAARRAEEAQVAAAAPAKAQIKGTYTTTAVSLKDRWSAEITDLSVAFKAMNRKGHPCKPLLEAAIRECIQRYADKQAVALKTLDPDAFPAGIIFKKDRV